MKLLNIAACSLLYLAAFGLVGGIVSFIFDLMDISPYGPITTALYYVLWGVLGIFAGLLSYQGGSQITSQASISPLTVLFVEAIVLLASLLPAFLLSGDLSLTLTFFIAILASAIFSHFSWGPAKT